MSFELVWSLEAEAQFTSLARVADLTRRAELSQAANERYLEALGTIDAGTPLKQLTDKLCRPVHDGKRRYRGQQLAILQQKSKTPRLRQRDRIFWTWLSRIWADWRSALLIVRPDTAVRRHR